jgi:F-type H+-transporting ATPase subunit epsilon
MTTPITVHCDIVSQEQQIFSGLVEIVSVTGAEGELGIMAGHTALLSAIQPGEVRVTRQGGQKEIFYISGGILEVQPDCITILADTVVRAESIDEAEAIKAKEHAQKLLADKRTDVELNSVLLELSKAAAQLRALKKSRQYR